MGDVVWKFKAFWPARKSTALQKYVVQATSDEQEATAMDAGKVGPLGFFITNLVAAHLQSYFTAGIAKRQTTHERNRGIRAREYHHLGNHVRWRFLPNGRVELSGSGLTSITQCR
jgi:hypothetical protein